MVSKIVCLSLLAALASTVNAYTYYAHIILDDAQFPEGTIKIHPIDVLLPDNDEAIVMEYVFPGGPHPDQLSRFSQHNYEKVVPDFLMEGSGYELKNLQVPGSSIKFSCQKIEEFTQQKTWKVYDCGNTDYYGKKGIPVSRPTTTVPPVVTPTCPIVTVTVPVTVATTNPPKPTTTPPKPTTTPPKPTPTCLPGYKGKRNGKGPNGACCSHSDDCKDTCVK
ncbi:hypothetical protein BGX34_011271, partial [Mortierella sp. NVP85]